MARIRTIKPEFWTDEKVVQLPFEVRLFFIGLFNFSDDDGFFEDEPERLRLQIFPNDLTLDIAEVLDQLAVAGMIEEVVAESGQWFWKIRNFHKHQKVSHPTPTKFPIQGAKKAAISAMTRRKLAQKYGCPPGESKDVECFYCGIPGRITWQRLHSGRPGAWVHFNLEIDHFEPESAGGESEADNLVLACRSCNRRKHNKSFADYYMKNCENSGALRSPPENGDLFGPEGKGIEGNRKERKEKGSSPSPRGKRIPKNWKPSAKLLKWAEKERPDLDLARVTESFVDYWTAKSGSAGTKLDWDATFRNWIRNEKHGNQNSNQNSKRNSSESPAQRRTRLADEQRTRIMGGQ